MSTVDQAAIIRAGSASGLPVSRWEDIAKCMEILGRLEKEDRTRVVQAFAILLLDREPDKPGV